MAVERGAAMQGQTVILRARFELGGTLFTPFNLGDVQILDENLVLVDTVPAAAIIMDAVGMYHVEWAIPNAEPAEIHHDRWFMMTTVGATEKQFTLNFFVLPLSVAAVSSYITVAEAKEYLPADTELTDAQILTLINQAVKAAESCCGQSFVPTTRSMVVDGSGRNVQPLKAKIQTVTEIEFLFDGTWTTVTYNDLRISGSRKMLSAGNSMSFSQQVGLGANRFGRYYSGAGGLGFIGSDFPDCTFPAGFQNIRVTGDWGRFTEVPLDIKDAVGRLVMYAGSCDDPTGSVSEPFSNETVPGGRAYTMRQILKSAMVDRMTGFADVDAVFARYPATFGATTVL